MEIATVIAYSTTFIATYFSLTSLPQILISGLIGRHIGPLISGLTGSITAWLVVDLLWIIFEGGHLPLAALIGALILLFGIEFIHNKELNVNARLMMAAEQWAIILVGIYIFIQSDVVRWY